jgi:hypothetical protein
VLAAGALSVVGASADPKPSAPPLPKVYVGKFAGPHQVARSSTPAVLSEFLLTSHGGDHHIERIGAKTGHRRTYAAFNNKSQDNCQWTEPSSGFEAACMTSNTYHFAFDSRIGLYEVPDEYVEAEAYKFTGKEVKCEGACTTSFAAPPAGFHFVLTGFEVSYDDDNKFVRRLSVLPYSTPGKLTMRFHDNGKPKFKGAVSGLFLPAAMFKVAKKEVTLTYKPGKPPPKLNLGYDAFALVGFDFEFLNGDHKLQTIGFKYERPYLVPKLADRNTDDPWRVKIQYAVLEL